MVLNLNFSWTALADTIWIDQPVGTRAAILSPTFDSSTKSCRDRVLDRRLDGIR